ncbi:hypothetical protein [Streptomyces griseoruber]|uniref:Uncharacterized protein n=1 Tax=Streptomyces griseoruber TaxID=1943 RepID=A0A101T2N5_9ACTN|nr:hypothetical protein [Streptomyces griseoruber]KUN84624.1 hypothetical protein AQJ64_14060 [Streptomyces griseoruber]
MFGCLGIVLFLVVVGEFLVMPVWMYDLMAAQTPPQRLDFGETTLLVLVSFLTATAIAWSAGRRRPGRLPDAVGCGLLLLGLCLAEALWLRQKMDTGNWSLEAGIECLAAGATAFAFRRLLRRWERGRPLPGEVWLAMVPFREREETARHYCVVVGRGLTRAKVLQITSQNKDDRADHVRIPGEGWAFNSSKDAHWMEIGLPPRHVPYRDFLKATPQGPCPRTTWRRIRTHRRTDLRRTLTETVRRASALLPSSRGN